MPITEALKTAQELRAAGMSAPLAEVVAAKLEQSAALSRDAAFDAVKAELSLLRSELMGEMGTMRGEIGAMRGEIGAMRGEMGNMKGEMGTMRGEMGNMKGETGAMRGEMGGLRAEIKADLERSLREVQGRMLTAILGVGALIITLLIGLKTFG
jgi:hypothetical protein